MSSNLEKIKEYLPFEDLVELFFDLFNKEYGATKADEIFNNVQKSNKANRFLADSLYSRKKYPPISFVTVINTGRFFLFKKPEVICYASLILLVNWKLKVGVKLDSENGLSDESYLKKMLFGIITASEKQKTHISGNPNLFDRYYKILLNLQDELANLIEAQNTGIDEEQDNDDDIIEDEGEKIPRPYYELIIDINLIKEIKSIIETKPPPLIILKPMQGIVGRKGVDNIILNESTANHVVEKYGKAYDLYDLYDENSYSIEMKYDLLDFSCFFHQENLLDGLDVKIFAVRLWKKHKAFQKHCKEFFRHDSENTSLQDVFEYYRTDAEYVKCFDNMFYVDFGFYRYCFFPPEYDGQNESYLKIESIMIVKSKSL